MNIEKSLYVLIAILIIAISVLIGCIISNFQNANNVVAVYENNIGKTLENEANSRQPIVEQTPTEEPFDNNLTKEPNEEIESIDFVPTKDTYYIKVNNQMNTVTIYAKDEQGNYTKPVKAMICSTGEDTPQNKTYIINGKRWDWKDLFGNVYGQYTTHIDGNILFHSVPYLQNKKKDTLEYWEYDKLGTTASLGCIRLKVEDAKWIYDYCMAGTIVEFYSDSNPGPLGKPTIEPISEYEEYRNWDPTDPDENNPWRNIKV